MEPNDFLYSVLQLTMPSVEFTPEYLERIRNPPIEYYSVYYRVLSPIARTSTTLLAFFYERFYGSGPADLNMLRGIDLSVEYARINFIHRITVLSLINSYLCDFYHDNQREAFDSMVLIGVRFIEVMIAPAIIRSDAIHCTLTSLLSNDTVNAERNIPLEYKVLFAAVLLTEPDVILNIRGRYISDQISETHIEQARSFIMRTPEFFGIYAERLLVLPEALSAFASNTQSIVDLSVILELMKADYDEVMNAICDESSNTHYYDLMDVMCNELRNTNRNIEIEQLRNIVFRLISQLDDNINTQRNSVLNLVIEVIRMHNEFLVTEPLRSILFEADITLPLELLNHITRSLEAGDIQNLVVASGGVYNEIIEHVAVHNISSTDVQFGSETISDVLSDELTLHSLQIAEVDLNAKNIESFHN